MEHSRSPPLPTQSSPRTPPGVAVFFSIHHFNRLSRACLGKATVLNLKAKEEEDKGVGGVALRRRYNLTELHELQAFASARGVAIIGEKIQKRHFLSTFNVYKI